LRLIKFSITFTLLFLAVSATAQQHQDPWLKRNWNNMIARYNIYFNAQQKLDKAVRTIAQGHKDDFEAILPIYPYGTKESAKGMKATLDEAMKKASMVIQNKPKSKWADDAYFIIGQTHFFSGDYYAAIEVFQFIIGSYRDPFIKDMCQLWLMKSYIALEKYDDAEAIFGLLSDKKSEFATFNTHLNLSGGDLLIKQEKYKQATEYLEKGLQGLKDKQVKYRTYFTLGQLYLLTEDYKKANNSFIKVLKLNAPYEYVFQANLGMARSTAQSGGKGAKSTKRYLKRMLGDDKNIEYFDQIYFELAKLEFSEGNENAGLEHMLLSAKNSSSNKTQSTKTYLYLANHYFNSREYDKAQSYYDTTVSVLPDKFPDADKIRGKHAVLSKLIDYIEEIRLQDSLLDLSKLDRNDLDRRITKIIEAEKERERIAKEEELIRRDQERFNNGNSAAATPPGGGGGSVWYFYNPMQVSRGTNDFIRNWGNRKKGDWWRFINKSVVESTVKEKKNEDEETSNPDDYYVEEDEEQQEALKDLDEEKLEYYKPIPFSTAAKLVALKKIENAYHGIGKIYFNDLKEYRKSIAQFNQLITRFPETKHEPEALFYLSKAHTELGEEDNASKYAKKVAEDFPETPYNQVLNAKEIVEEESDKEVVNLYTKMYNAYDAGSYDEVFTIKQQIDKEYPGSSIQGKIDYLYALTIGKTKGKEAYIEELEILKDAYIGTEIGEMASYTLRLLQNKIDVETSNNIYNKNTSGIHYYVITGTTDDVNKVKLELDKYNSEFFSTQKLQINNLMLGDKQLFYIKQYNNKEEVQKYHNEVKNSLSFLTNSGLISIEIYGITEENFRTLVKTKEEEEYLKFFRRNYD
jgi:tetratricopeptide (TPR) repeat protein